MILTVSNVKGGSGKTTTAMYLAHAMALQSRKVTVVDACPSGSATLWADDATDLDTPLPFEVVPMANPNMERRVRALAANTDVVIDSAPANAPIGRAAVDLADFALIPANPRPEDVRQATAIANEALKNGTPSAVVLVRVRPQESSMDVCREMLAAANVAVFETEIHELMAIGWSHGTLLEDVTSYGQLLKEIDGVFA